ncbi:MAG: S24 family peptidase [Bacteroidota bacterium]
MSRKHLTSKQHSFLKYLKDYVKDNGVWPTYRELVDEFGYRSPNSVTQNLQALFKKGFLVKEDEGYQLSDMMTTNMPAQMAGIPIRGIITAGLLQEAVEANMGTITLETLFPKLDRMFAIRVSGQSMIGADINDGDYVLLIDDDIPNGGIGAVLYNGETSLKRIYQETEGLRLEPANDDYPDVYIKPDVFEEVNILGRYIGHVNRDGIYKRTMRNKAA